MTIEKRGNGYRIREMRNLKRYSIMVYKKPTRSEAQLLIDEYIDNHSLPTNPTLYQCCQQYNFSKIGAVSGNTIRKYKSLVKLVPKCIGDVKLSKLNNYNMQLAISEWTKKLSRSSTITMYKYVISVISMFAKMDFDVSLPKKEIDIRYVPTIDDVKKIFDYTKNTNIGALFVLLCYGLRIGEALALTKEDVFDEYVSINKTLSYDENGNRITKDPKTSFSVRKVPMNKTLIDYVRSYGFDWKSLVWYRTQLNKILTKLNIPHFSFHSCRKFFASYCQHIGVGIPKTKALGGWSKSSNIMESVYSVPIDLYKPVELPLQCS